MLPHQPNRPGFQLRVVLCTRHLVSAFPPSGVLTPAEAVHHFRSVSALPIRSRDATELIAAHSDGSCHGVDVTGCHLLAVVQTCARGDPFPGWLTSLTPATR